MCRPLLALLFALVVATPAAAHTELAASTPADGAVVNDPPVEVVLEFTSALSPDGVPEVTVTDGVGDDLVAAPPTVDRLLVTVPLNLAVTPGLHTVEWTVSAVDGHLLSGTFAFAYEPAVAPQPVEAAATSQPTPTRPAVGVATAPSPTPTPAPPPTATDMAAEAPTPTPAATPAEDVVEASSFAGFAIGAGLLSLALAGVAFGVRRSRRS